MARWRLMVPHYLNTVHSLEWEYSAVQSGKSVRKRFNVPRYLDVNDPSDWTVKIGTGTPIAYGGNDDGAAGIIIVCYQNRGEPGDIEFLGDPTPDMMPLDDEAKEISARYTTHWSYKPDTAEVPFSQTIFDKLDEMKSVIETPAPAPVKVEGLSEIMAMMAQSQKLIADALAANTTRRI